MRSLKLSQFVVLRVGRNLSPGACSGDCGEGVGCLESVVYGDDGKPDPLAASHFCLDGPSDLASLQQFSCGGPNANGNDEWCVAAEDLRRLASDGDSLSWVSRVVDEGNAVVTNRLWSAQVESLALGQGAALNPVLLKSQVGSIEGLKAFVDTLIYLDGTNGEKTVRLVDPSSLDWTGVKAEIES